MEKYLIENNMASEEEMKEIDDRVRDVIEDAEEFADNSPYPEGEEAIEGLYATPIGRDKEL
jgi:pyruvate dehydrogenase E1 component alpha subunit